MSELDDSSSHEVAFSRDAGQFLLRHLVEWYTWEGRGLLHKDTAIELMQATWSSRMQDAEQGLGQTEDKQRLETTK